MASFNDPFDRPDAGTLGASWREYTAGFHVVSGAAVCDTTATNVAQYATDMASGDHYGEMEIGNSYGGTFTGVAARMPTLGTDGASTGAFYLMILSGSTGTAFSIRRKEVNATTLTTLASGTSAVDGRLDGSVWRLEANTNPSNSAQVLLRAYLNGTLLFSTTDASTAVPATQRRVGIYTGGTTGPDLRIARVAGADLALAGDTTAPTVPGSVSATAASSSSVTITWTASTDNTSVASYRVRRGGVDVAGATALTVLTFTDTGLAAGTYGYTVSAVDAAGNRSGESPVSSVTLTPQDTTAPPVPTGLTATAGASQVALSWTAVSASDLAGYRVYRWTTAAPTHTLISSPTTTTFTDTGVTAGTAYSYAVRSLDQAGNASAESSTATATPTAPSGTGYTFTRWSGSTEQAATLSGVWTGSTTTPVVSVQGISSGSTPASTTTGGSGGALTDTTLLSHTGAGYTADYHLYAAGLDWAKPVGMLLYIDGTGEFGIENPTDTYLLAGTNGLIATAKRQNMLLLTPFSPDRVEQSWHYNDPTGYTAYLETLIRYIYSRYNLDKSRFVGAGYSSGAQVMSRYLTPQVLTTNLPAIALDGLMLMISFGGHPAVTMGTTIPQVKANMRFHWDVGDADDQGGYDGDFGALVGEDWYRTRGWATSINVIAGGTHNRSDFGLVTDRAMSLHVTRVAQVGAYTATRTSTGMTWAGKVNGTSSITLRASSTPLSGGQVGFYLTVPVDATTRDATATLTSFTAGTAYNWQIEVNNPTPAGQGGQVIASGTVPGAP